MVESKEEQTSIEFAGEVNTIPEEAETGDAGGGVLR